MMPIFSVHAFTLVAATIGGALLTTAAVTGFMIGYARRRGMLDHPGQRRSHDLPTPRGGGLGLVLGAVLGMSWWLFRYWPASLATVFIAAAAAIAFVGWLDDRRDLSARSRMLVHLLAAMAYGIVLLRVGGWSFWWLVPLMLAAAWSVNLHNFMDGTDGMLGLQLVFIGLLSAALCMLGHDIRLAVLNLTLSAAAVGFLIFNLPPARIFMGDVGSGCAGMLVFMLATLWCLEDVHALWLLLIMHAVFVTDSGLTLAGRMLRGKRWYTAHREHLYQWLVRSGSSHGHVAGLYTAYNLAVLAPLAWFAAMQPANAPWYFIAAYALSAFAWWSMRRACLQRVTRRATHAHA